MGQTVTEQIYERPYDYDLEHGGDDDDVRFYERLLAQWRPRRVLELACGSARVTLPLAEMAAREGFDIVGLELAEPMLHEAERKRAAASAGVRSRLTFVPGDMRTWRGSEAFDAILTPGSSMGHLLTLEDQLGVWRAAWDNLSPGGRFVVDVPCPDLATCALATTQCPPRQTLELDTDFTDPDTGERLIRYKAVAYLPHEQRAQTTFVYDKFQEDHHVERYVSDFAAHVYFPRELELLFLHTGFLLEAMYGDWRRRPLRRTSSQMIAIGRKRHAAR
jgi:SAM-dependent methyltransferase